MYASSTSSTVWPPTTTWPWYSRWLSKAQVVELGRNSPCAIGSASGPLSRTTPMPASPGAVAMAAMVSSYMSGSLASRSERAGAHRIGGRGFQLGAVGGREQHLLL